MALEEEHVRLRSMLIIHIGCMGFELTGACPFSLGAQFVIFPGDAPFRGYFLHKGQHRANKLLIILVTFKKIQCECDPKYLRPVNIVVLSYRCDVGAAHHVAREPKLALIIMVIREKQLG